MNAVNELAAAETAAQESEAAVAEATDNLVSAVSQIEETSAAAQAAIDAALEAGYTQAEIDAFIASLSTLKLDVPHIKLMTH